MTTKILKSDSPDNITLCAKVIKNGGLVAIPTETVYGLGANALDEKAVASIFTVKGREPDNPLIVHVASMDDVNPLVAEIPDAFYTLAKKFWPGSLTLVMKKSDIVPDIVTAGLDTVAVRMPNHPAALSLINACNCPIAAPSANPSGRPSPTKAEHVLDDLDGKIPYILDGGDCVVGVESTILDISGQTPQILRPGGVTYDELKAVLQDVTVFAQVEPTGASSPRSPGMKYRHYAPKAPMTAVLGEPEKTAGYIKSRLHGGSGSKAGALMFDDHAFEHPNVITYGLFDDYVSQANRLFDALRMFDSLEISEIFAQTPTDCGLGCTVANRIKKAAGDNLIQV